MKTCRRLVVLLLSFMTLAGNAQTVDEGTAALRSVLLKQQRFMHGFSADPETHWRWKDGVFVQTNPNAHIFSAVVANSVKVRGTKVEINADRFAVFRNKDGSLALVKLDETARMIVDLTGADVAAVLPHLADALFYRDLNEALAALPLAFKDFVPPSLNPADKPQVKPTLIKCDCSEITDNNCSNAGDLQDNKMKPPKLTYSVEPEYSNQAKNHKFNDSVQVGIEIDTSGKVSDVWIVRPAGMGLDASAVSAVRQYRFDPATCHGQPVTVSLFIDITFQIF